MEVMTDKQALTEKQINSAYEDNGRTFTTYEKAMEYIKMRGYSLINGNYCNKVGRIAYLYKVTKDIHRKEGYLVSFGGNPRSAFALKITKIRDLNA